MCSTVGAGEVLFFLQFVKSIQSLALRTKSLTPQAWSGLVSSRTSPKPHCSSCCRHRRLRRRRRHWHVPNTPSTATNTSCARTVSSPDGQPRCVGWLRAHRNGILVTFLLLSFQADYCSTTATVRSTARLIGTSHIATPKACRDCG